MLTGKHTVCDIYCKVCTVIIGWSYIKAHEEDQKYKEGKFIIERAYITKKPSGYSTTADHATASTNGIISTTNAARIGGRGLLGDDNDDDSDGSSNDIF
mmetsp:Transcript_35790/g.48316  ORF Transcript_35790/g.48316 Transcript_35790/m.48316 type:complete len:99 (-) Transcript_35790:128-424(-)